MLAIQCIRSEEELERLRSSWNPLLQKSASDCIFLTWEWVRNWWKVFGEAFSLRVLVARSDDGEILGIAPLTVDRRRRLLIVGQAGETRAEHLDFLVLGGQEGEVTPAFCRYALEELSGDWDRVFFERVLRSSPNLPLMLRAFDRAPWQARLCRDEASPYVKLGGSWEGFLAGKKKKFRNQWRNSCRRLEKRGSARVLLAGEDIPFAEAFDHLRRLHRKRWGEGGNFRTEKYLAFHHAFAREILEKGWLCLLLLAVDSSVVAASYDFAYGSKVWGMQGGWDPDYEHERVGTLVVGEAIRWGIRKGLAEYDFLGGDHAYKRRWATDERWMAYLEVCPAG